MKPRRDNPDEDWDQLAREREEQRQDQDRRRTDEPVRGDPFYHYPIDWFIGGDEW